MYNTRHTRPRKAYKTTPKGRVALPDFLDCAQFLDITRPCRAGLGLRLSEAV